MVCSVSTSNHDRHFDFMNSVMRNQVKDVSVYHNAIIVTNNTENKMLVHAIMSLFINFEIKFELSSK